MSQLEAHAAEVQKKKYEQELSDDWHTLRQQIKAAAAQEMAAVAQRQRQAEAMQLVNTPKDWGKLYQSIWVQNGGTSAINGTVVGNFGPIPVVATTPQGDPDGPLVPLPDRKATNPAPYAAPAHDYIAALYRPYVSPV